MRARALAAWFAKVHGPDAVEVRQWQVLEESSDVDHFGVKLYNWIQRCCPRVHHIYFNFLEWAGLHRGRLRGGVARRFRARLNDFRPDVVVSVHAHLNHAYFAEAKAWGGGKIRCFTYCGELEGGYGFSRHWVNPKADGFIAAVDACGRAAHRLGMPTERITVGGFLLQPSFYERSAESVADLRMRLWGDCQGRPVLLLGTGANGANQHKRVLAALADTGVALVVVALCGRNEATRREILRCRDQWSGLRVIPLAYREDMADILRSVDLAFIRPGTGTTSECVRSVCPILFNGLGGVMPQERITVRFLKHCGYPVELARSPRECARRVQRMLGVSPGSGGTVPRFTVEREILASINPGLRPERVLDALLA